VSLEEALMRLAEFLSVQLGAEESYENPHDQGKVRWGGVLRGSHSSIHASLHKTPPPPTPHRTQPYPSIFSVFFYFFSY
jgi:hypothetical protein